MLTWVDLLALMVLALSLALGYRGGLVLAWVGLLGLPLYAAALALGLPAFWTALAVGLVLGALAKSLPLFLSEAAERGLGLLGGGLLGLFLAAAIWTGFPSEPAPSGGIRYPSLRLPPPIYQGGARKPLRPPGLRLGLGNALGAEGVGPRGPAPAIGARGPG